jgi:hypothetical protein
MASFPATDPSGASVSWEREADHSAQGGTLQAREAEKAMAALRRAFELGFRSVAFRDDDILDPLRSRDDFRLLMMDLDIPADPFAR